MSSRSQDIENRRGFETIRDLTFVAYKEMAFIAPRFDQAAIEQMITDGYTAASVQSYFNHAHLFGYVTEIDTQRLWAKELQRAWVATLEEAFPANSVHVEIEDDGFDVVVRAFVDVTQ